MTSVRPHPSTVSDVTYDAQRVCDEYRTNARRIPPETIGSWHQDGLDHLGTLVARPELRPLAEGVRFGLHHEGPVYMLRDGLVSLHTILLERSDAAAATVLRHALEVALLDRLLPGDDDAQIAALGLACQVARGYLDGLTAAESELALNPWPAWTDSLVAPCTDDAAGLLEHTFRHAAALFALRAWDADAALERFQSPELQRRVLGRLTALLPLALPTERLLTLGGDSRLPIDPATGLNRYGCSPRPRPWANTFSSCTATSVSEVGFKAAERCRQRLITAVSHDGFKEAILDHSESIRRAILHQLQLDEVPGTELVLTSSGTDAELLALYFACGDSESAITTVVLAPTEVGSGTLPAAAGKHFDSLTPLGGPAHAGSPVAGLPAERLELLQIPVRNEDGTLIAASDLDAVIEATVRDRCEAGGIVLLHLVDSSKTGVGAPSVGLARRLADRYPTQLTVVVDAAQMRVSRPALRRYLDHGFLLLITGSKFFTGPPFSGGLVVPPAMAGRVDRLPPLPAGLAAYTSRSDFPLRWRGLTRGISLGTNVGSLLRWRAALWQMEAFFAVPPERQFSAVRHFVKGLTDAVARSPWVDMVDAPALTRHPDGGEQAWDSTQTIFSLLVRHADVPAGEPPYLTLEEAQRLYRWLNADISSLLPEGTSDDEHRIASSRCHLGQPVVIFTDRGRKYAAIRIAFGARLCSRVEMDPLLGETDEARKQWELGSALAVLAKIELIARHWAVLCEMEETRPGWQLPLAGAPY